MSKEWGFLCGKATDHNAEEAEGARLGRDQPHQGPRQPVHHKVAQQDHHVVYTFAFFITPQSFFPGSLKLLRWTRALCW